MNNEKRFLTNQNQVINNKLLYEELTYKIRGCIFTVYNSLGYGHKESVYQKALELELTENNLNYFSQKIFQVDYKNIKVGIYKPDLIIENKILIEIKATEYNTEKFEQQVINYLKATPYKLGLLINFGTEKVFIKRLVDTHK